MRAKWFVAILCAALALFLASCRAGPLIYDVQIRPDVISPNADGVDDVAAVSYKIGSNANISIYLIDAQGNKHYFRRDGRRSHGSYTALFSGVIDGRMLPDGTYTMVLEATNESGRTEKIEKSITLVDADTNYIEIRNLNIYPSSFTPNRDGIKDRVTIAYYLNKEATIVRVYLLGPDGEKYPIPDDKIRPMGAPGNHEHDYEGGVDLGAAPPPDGTYTVVVEAEDAVGNRDQKTGQLTIEVGGVPMAEIVNRAVQWSGDSYALGQTLTFTCTVRNIGKVPIRTQGPESGYTYTNAETYGSCGYYTDPGVFRVGLDMEDNSIGREYPWRWQLGKDSELTVIDGHKYLMPGQTVQVVGHLTFVDKTPRTAPYFWVGLIHEEVRKVDDRVDPKQVTIDF
ncbi:MAG: hypothetical protein H5T64_08285 [Chloroflexi bacterium]|nr:hypothetical protein [Chloroflexota bacterium]